MKGVLFIEESIVTKVLSKTQLNFCKLCLHLIKSLNNPKLLNKNSELINTFCHQSKLFLKSFKKNWYSNRSDTMDWYLVLRILFKNGLMYVLIFDVSVCCNKFYSILTYSPFQNNILFVLYNIWSVQYLSARPSKCFVA